MLKKAVKHEEFIKYISNALFYLAFVMYMSLSVLWTSTAMRLLTSRGYLIGMAIVTALLVLRETVGIVLIRRYNWKDFIGLVIVLILGYIVDRNETATIAVGYFLIFASREMEYKKIYKIAILNTAIGIVIVYIMARKGWITDATWLEWPHVRHAFGFVYPLVIPAYILNIGMMTFVVYENRISSWYILVLSAFTILTYYCCKADLSSGLMALVLIAMIIVKAYPKIIYSKHIFWKLTDCMAIFIYPIASICSFLLVHYYDSSIAWMNTLNTMTKGRLSFPQVALRNYGIKIWGQEIWFVGAGLDNFGNEVSGHYNYVDNAYINLLIRYGILFFAIAMILIVLTMNYCRIRRLRIVLWMFSLMAVHGILEDKVQTLYFNSLLLIIGQALQHYHASKKYT